MVTPAVYNDLLEFHHLNSQGTGQTSYCVVVCYCGVSKQARGKIRQ